MPELLIDSMNDDIILKVHDVGLTYKKMTFRGLKNYYQVLSNVSFNMKKGESIAIIGRNGAGKSSLLKLIAGIMSPTQGSIQLKEGLSSTLLSLHAGFDINLSGKANVYLQGMLLGLSKSYIKKKIPDIIEFSELAAFIDKPVKDYSSGMAARLGFAIALQLNPDLLLIDEVLSVGDVNFQIKSLNVMREKLKSDQSIIMVSHDALLVKSLCTRAVWIEDGVCRVFGDAAEVVNLYEDHMRRELNEGR